MNVKKIFKIEGMSCQHCERAIEKALKVNGVSSVEASHVKKLARIEYDPDVIMEDNIKRIIMDAGYNVIAIAIG